MSTKYVYTFGDGKAEGKADMKNLLGGKGANLAEMNLIGLPVPAGFTITTEVCTLYNQKVKDAVVKLRENDVKAGIAHMEKIMNAKFGSKGEAFPLMVSVRSGARVSMPGMMDTVLNLGLNDDAVKLLAEKSGNARFAWDSYRRFIQMYGDVVMGVAAAKGEHNPFEVEIDKLKEAKHIKQDTEFTVEDLQVLVENFKKVVKTKTGKDFPTCPWEQLWGAICAVFDSWMTERAVLYRQLNQIPEEWGTAVNVQSMVYGNMGNNSATGVAFSRDAATGEDIFNGEYLINAQGEDVVAGIRTPQEITIEGSRRWAKLQGISEEERASKYPSLEEAMPQAYADLNAVQEKLEDHFHDMQDMEFTIQDGKLWMLQTRNGKRTGAAMVKMAVDMLKQGMIDEKTALLRQEPAKLDELLHPVFNKEALKKAHVITKGTIIKEGDWISLNGSTGEVYLGKVETEDATLDEDFTAIMNLAEKYTRMYVRTNADTPKDARKARDFGAKGVGLCRTEHMFFEGHRIDAMREMILSDTVEGRRVALNKILPMQRGDFEGILEAMNGLGVTIRLLDPPLHEFTPNEPASQQYMAQKLGIPVERIKEKVDALHEFNPMLGHRGCRLGVTYPEITEMQARAIIEAACNLKLRGLDPRPEIMVPLVGTVKELKQQAEIINRVAAMVFEEKGVKVDYKVGTMIEIPRAAITADQIAEVAEFFSFGTNDLTQMTFGYSRDDAGKFLPEYIRKGILKTDPFAVLDQEGVGRLVEMGVKLGRKTNADLKVGICGEHGGEPSSVIFCDSVGMNYVSCSPFRVPIARVAAAQAAIMHAGK